MIKHGKVQKGTPSVVSGLPSDILRKGEPIKRGEQPVDPGLKKLAKAISGIQDEHQPD